MIGLLHKAGGSSDLSAFTFVVHSLWRCLRYSSGGESVPLLAEVLRERIKLRVGRFDTGVKMGNTAKNLAFREGFLSWRGEKDLRLWQRALVGARRVLQASALGETSVFS